MTLHVPFDQFADSVGRLLSSKEVFASAHGNGTLVTAADPQKGFLLVCRTEMALSIAKKKLSDAGLQVHEGAWRLTDEPTAEEAAATDAYVAAVAYKSGESMPGLWMDAYTSMPTEVQVLRSLYEEFRETGELPEVSFEEFVRLAEPNVVIVSPNEIQSFLEKKSDC